jgi:DNA repair exonuclease SbcCD ATPase subunit
MNTLRSTTKLSVVKILITIPVLMLMLSGLAYADTRDSAKVRSDGTDGDPSGNNDIEIAKLRIACRKPENNSTPEKVQECLDDLKITSNSLSGENCLSQKKDAAAAKKDIDDACTNSGSGGDSDCYSQAKRCENVIQDADGPSPMDQIYSAASSYTGTTIAPPTSKKNQNGCPQFSSEQYLKRRKEITDELSKLKDDIRAAKKESADLEKDTQKDIKDAQKDVQDAQAKQKEDGHKVDDDTREQVKKASDNQGTLKKALTDNDLNIVKLRGKAMQSQEDQASKLIQINDNAVKDICVAQYQTRLDAFMSARAKMSLSFAEMKSTKNSMISGYQTCIKTYEQQRVALMESKSQEQAEIRQQIGAAQSDMDETQHSLDLTQTQLTEIQTSAKAKKNEGGQQLQASMQTAQTSMQTASQNMQKQQQIFTQKQTDLNKRMNDLNAELNAMGTQPDSDATMSTKKAAAIIRSRIQTISSYSSNSKCCPSGSKDPLCGLPAKYDDADENASDPQFKGSGK